MEAGHAREQLDHFDADHRRAVVPQPQDLRKRGTTWRPALKRRVAVIRRFVEAPCRLAEHVGGPLTGSPADQVLRAVV